MRPEPTCFGHLQSDWLDFGPTLKVIGGMRYSLLVRDRFTKALGCLGSQTRKAEHVVKLYQRFASNRPVFTSYTDGGRELSRANELLGWEQPTSPPYRPQANPVERFVLLVQDGMKAISLCSGLGPEFSPLALKMWCQLYNLVYPHPEHNLQTAYQMLNPGCPAGVLAMPYGC